MDTCLNIYNIINAPLGHSLINSEDRAGLDKIVVEFKKTINIRQYESEVFSQRLEISIPSTMTSMERMLVMEVAQAQIEYGLHLHLWALGALLDGDLVKRQADLIKGVQAVLNTALSTGVGDMKHIINY